MRVGPRFVYTVGGTESVSIRYLMTSGIMHTTTKNTMNIVPINQRLSNDSSGCWLGKCDIISSISCLFIYLILLDFDAMATESMSALIALVLSSGWTSSGTSMR